MVSEKKFVIEVTAKELVDLKINSISSAKRWINEHLWSVERSVERSVKSVKTVDNDKVDNKELVSDVVGVSVGNTESYKPEPIQKPKFNFNGFSQMTTEHESSSSTRDYFRKMKENMGY